MVDAILSACKIVRFAKVIVASLELDTLGNEIEVDRLIGLATAEKKKVVAVQQNDNAMASLTLAFATDEFISIIANNQSVE